MAPARLAPFARDNLRLIYNRVEAPCSFVPPLTILSVANVKDIFRTGLKLLCEIGSVPKLPCPGRNIRDGRRALPGILHLQPANHNRTTSQQSLNQDSDGANTAFKFDRDEQSVRIVNLGFAGSDPLPCSGKFLALDFEFECVDRQSVHLLPFPLNLNVGHDLASRLPIAAHPSTVAQLFVANRESGAETNTRDRSGSHDRCARAVIWSDRGGEE